MHKERVRVLENVKVSHAFYRLTFRSKAMAKDARAGHFVQMRVVDCFDPFLPRPMSIAGVRGDLVDILYIVAGRGTRLMANVVAGAEMSCWGPLGKPFTRRSGKHLIFVAGGVGIAPLIFLASTQPADSFLFGVRTKDDLLPSPEFSVEASRLLFSSNDGSIGEKGYITQVFERLIEKADAKNTFVYTCGPNPMMEKVVRAAKGKGIPGEASLEETMACGVGACLGCVVDTKRGRLTVCHDGPVIPFEALSW